MTVQEAKLRYGVQQFIPSYGMTITQVVDTLYNGDRSDNHYYTLTQINNRQDWEYIVDVDSPIYYLSAQACSEVNEIIS